MRVDGRELRCRVVGEGGNLGFTQRGRIDYALHGGPEHEGGRINTDSIDNVAGVNTSDHEVNIKILLDSLVSRGELTEDERNRLLIEMTDAVADQVLDASYTQTQAISLALAQAAPMIDVHARLIRRLEQVAGLDRELEFLPSDDAISDRKAAHQGLLGPELAIVMAYCKIHLYGRLLDSDLPQDEYLAHDLERYFPPPLPERYAEQMRDHRLRREIVATVVANQLVDRAGHHVRVPPRRGDGRLSVRAGAGLRGRARGVRDALVLVRGRAARQRDRRRRAAADADHGTGAGRAHHPPAGARGPRGADRASGAPLPARGGAAVGGDPRDPRRSRARGVRGARGGAARRGGPCGAGGAGGGDALAPPVFDIVAVADDTDREFEDVMLAYFALASRLELSWLRDRIYELPRGNRWQALARAALRDDLLSSHRELTRQVLESAGEDETVEQAIEAWAADNDAALERYLSVIADIRASRTYDNTTLPVALREVRGLIREGKF